MSDYYDLGPYTRPVTTASKEAQAWFDANQSDPMPRCFCGRPSNIGWMGQGFCSREHYQEGKAKAATEQSSSDTAIAYGELQ